MALFTSKVDYALRALLDLACQRSGRPAQSREIAVRQDIPESYLNQLLVILRRAGLVRSVRGAAGGYVLGREPGLTTVADVVDALHGADFLGERPGGGSESAAAWAIRGFHGRLSGAVRRELQGTSLADLLSEVERLDEARSVMAGL